MKRIATLACLLVAGAAMAQSTTKSGAPSDVPPDHWAFKAVDNLYRAGILQGYPGSKFNGTRPAARYELGRGIDGMVQSIRADIAAIEGKIQNAPKAQDLSDIRAQIESLRAEIAEMRRQREEVNTLTERFGGLRRDLQRLRGDVDGMRRDLGSIKGR